MPELPEVETTRRGLEPHVINKRVVGVVVRRPDLRVPIPAELARVLVGQRLLAVKRRAKYLLLETAVGSALVHLGMSGTLRLTTAKVEPTRHDHVDFCFEGGAIARLNDPRRFGAVVWQPAGTLHALLAHLGPEPLGPDFSAKYMFEASRDRRVPVKVFLMDQAVVVGVGNIYAAESLFVAGVDPRVPAGASGFCAIALSSTLCGLCCVARSSPAAQPCAIFAVRTASRATLAKIYGSMAERACPVPSARAPSNIRCLVSGRPCFAAVVRPKPGSRLAYLGELAGIAVMDMVWRALPLF